MGPTLSGVLRPCGGAGTHQTRDSRAGRSPVETRKVGER